MTNSSLCDTPLRRNLWPRRPRTFEPLGVIKIQTYRDTHRNTLSVAVSFDLKNSKRFKSSRVHKLLPIDSRGDRGDRGDRRGAMTALEADPGR